MKYLLFDYTAISLYVQTSTLQSIEFTDGQSFFKHICGNGQSENFLNTVVYYTDDGVIFSGCNLSDKRIFCIDLTSCNILSEKDNPADLLTIVQKILRTALKIWNKQPFSSSERVNNTKSIVFPFAVSDRRRVVIERSNNIDRLSKRGINQPLLAYKYNAEEPTQREDQINIDVLRDAGETYCSVFPCFHNILVSSTESNSAGSQALAQVASEKLNERDDFIYWEFERQYKALTTSQKKVVDYGELSSPLRIEGAAGTGKTISLLMRAYRILSSCRDKSSPIKMIFFTHSTSTCMRNRELFSFWDKDFCFQNNNSQQSIRFTTLLDFCCELSKYGKDELIEKDASDAKNYGMMLIESILEDKRIQNKINTFFPLLSKRTQDAFNQEKTNTQTLCRILQHEFGIQIKGRTNYTLDEYKNLSSIANVLPSMSEKDKELVFSIFNEYQNQLKELGNYDIDDVTIESLSILNAPRWRRERQTKGYDYIFVDEMHLFNFNEQNIFHLLSKGDSKSIPMCFALDYSQAIGDRGDKSNDYIEKELQGIETQKYNTIFRNSPQISEFCRSIAASGTLMFQANFENPYVQTQSSFTSREEEMASKPTLLMYKNDEDMLHSLNSHIDNMTKKLQCKLSDIAIISFDDSYLYADEIKRIKKIIKKEIRVLRYGETQQRNDAIILSSPYDINGLEFSGVILLGTDEGRIPQTSGISDISKHFISYSSYNLLYLCSSRAKYQLLLLGTDTRGVSSCLQHSISAGYLDINHID